MPQDPTARLLAAIEGIDLASADGRAGLGALLCEIERLSPDAILQQAAGIDLRRLGWGREAERRDDGREASPPAPI